MISMPGAGIPNNFQDPAIARPFSVSFGIVAIVTAAGFEVDSPGPPAPASDGAEFAVWPASGTDLRKIDMPMKIKKSDDKIKITGASAAAERFVAKIETSSFLHRVSSGAGLLRARA